VPVRTIAHWIHATRQELSDFPQLQTLINGRLTYGLKIVEENQILLGDGTGENILGLIPQATAYNTALNRANDSFIDVIRHAILQVRLAFYPADGIVLTPTDWHNIELTKDNENRYLMANPQGNMPPMLWGRPVVESDGMPNDQFLVGAFRMAATLFDREQATIAVSTEDRDNFIKNMVTILVEERIALAVARPAAFVHGSFPAGSTT
jgi:HK97 family phage major capsid protein